jgi:glucose-1-phosphatase
MIQFLYFDLGKVLLEFSNERMLAQVAQVAGVSVADLQRALFPRGDESDPQWLFEAGQLDEEEYFDFFCRATGANPDRAALTTAACDIFTPIAASKRLVEKLAASGHRLGLLSNTNPLHWRFLIDGRFPFLNECFEIQATSFAARSMKPARAVYDYAATQAGVKHRDIFFTDDRPENVEGALEAGFDAVQFRSAEQIADEIKQRGITW